MLSNAHIDSLVGSPSIDLLVVTLEENLHIDAARNTEKICFYFSYSPELFSKGFTFFCITHECIPRPPITKYINTILLFDDAPPFPPSPSLFPFSPSLFLFLSYLLSHFSFSSGPSLITVLTSSTSSSGSSIVNGFDEQRCFCLLCNIYDRWQ